MKRMSVSPVVAAALLFPTLLPAETVTSEPVIVTATRTARKRRTKRLASVSVITREDIERTQAKSVAELLTGEAGIDVTVKGGYGKDTSVFMRGTNSGHVLVLIDGVKIGSATLGTPSWQYLPLDQIERIEIVRGPRSSLYGADAIGGVVQIFTRQPTDKFQGRVSAGYGTYGTRDLSAGISGAEGDTRYSLSAGHFSTDGIDAKNIIRRQRRRPRRLPQRIFRRAPYAPFRPRHRDSKLHTLHSQGFTEYDGTPNQTTFNQDATGLRLRLSPHERWQIKLDAGNSRDYNDNFRNGGFYSTFNTNRYTAAWQNDVTLGKDQLLTLGLDYQDDRIGDVSHWPANTRFRKSAPTAAAFVQHQGRFGNHDLLVSWRQDDNEQFGTNDTGNLAWGYALTPTLRARASYGTAFKAPTFNDLYYPVPGNPNLKPEESESYKAGLRGKTTWGNWDVRAFQTNVDNLIAWVLVGSNYVPQNVDKGAHQGRGSRGRYTPRRLGYACGSSRSWTRAIPGATKSSTAAPSAP